MIRKANLGGSATCNGIAEPPRRSSAFATLPRDEAGFPGGDIRTLGTHGFTPVATGPFGCAPPFGGALFSTPIGAERYLLHLACGQMKPCDSREARILKNPAEWRSAPEAR